MKKILALETTEKLGSVALSDDELVLAEVSLPKDRRNAQTLAPAIDALLRENHCTPKEIEIVGVVVGPGSFTGLRVGVTSAKIFAYAIGAQVIAVNTFEAVAEDFASRTDTACRLVVGVDAQRGDVVLQEFEISSEKTWEPVSESRLAPIADCWEIAEKSLNVCFAGPFLERWGAKAPKNVRLCSETFYFPKASVVCRLAARKEADGETTEIGALLPVYSRLSAAEERLPLR